MQICYIHGAGASALSFKWLRANLPNHTAKFVLYPVDESVESVSDRLNDMLRNSPPTVLVGHSLGGIIAASCANSPQVKSLITICSPFGGIKYIDLVAMFSFEPLLHDLRPYGKILTSLRNSTITKPHLAIVGTQGLPFIKESNDGVVTVASQMSLSGPQYETVALNHFEMLLSDTVVTLITNFL